MLNRPTTGQPAHAGKRILPEPLPENLYGTEYWETPRFRPHNGATPAKWADYQEKVSARMRERVISAVPDAIPPRPVRNEEWQKRHAVPECLKCIPFRKEKIIDPITGRELYQITFPDGWGDGRRFHASVSYNYVSPWNPGRVSGESLILVVAMDIDDPDNGDNRIYVIRQDGREARCLMTHCRFDYTIVEGMPYIHAAPVGWLDARTVFICQKDGVNSTVDVITGEISFLSGMPATIVAFSSPNGRFIAFSPFPERPFTRSFGHSTVVDLSAQLWIYDREKQEARKIFDNTRMASLHPEFDPAKCELTWYCGNFQWSYDSSMINFFTMMYYDGRVVRDLCRIDPDGSNAGIILSSEDTMRYPTDGKPRIFGNSMPSGSILNNHQAILPNGKQILCCTQEPCALPPGKTPDPVDPHIDTRFLLLVDLDRSRIQILQGDDLNFDGHPTANPQGTLVLGSDYHCFIKIMDPRTGHVENLFRLSASSMATGHPHETWSPDGRFILFRRDGKNGELFSAAL